MYQPGVHTNQKCVLTRLHTKHVELHLLSVLIGIYSVHELATEVNVRVNQEDY